MVYQTQVNRPNIERLLIPTLLPINLIVGKDLDEGLEKNERNEDLVISLIDLQEIGSGENSLKSSATNVVNLVI